MLDRRIQQRIDNLQRALRHSYNQDDLLRQHQVDLERVLNPETPEDERERIILSVNLSLMETIDRVSEQAGQMITNERFEVFAEEYSQGVRDINRQLIALGSFVALRAYNRQDLQNIFDTVATFSVSVQPRVRTRDIMGLVADRDRSNFYFRRALMRLGQADTMASHIMESFRLAIGQGESIQQLTRRLQGALNSVRHRAERIARTECMRSYSQGSYLSATQGRERYGLRIVKTWHAILDDRVRDAHAELDGTTVELDIPFDANGEPMKHPIDPNASASNCVNCRCVVSYRVIM